MTEEEFLGIINELERILNLYDSSSISYENRLIYLASGEKLTVKFPKNNLAHILGVNTDYIKMLNILPSRCRNSYDILEFLIKSKNKFVALKNEGKIKEYDTLFSKYINQKLSAFDTNIMYVNLNETLFIAKYDNEKTYMSKPESDVGDYFIAKQYNGKYYLLGLCIMDTENINKKSIYCVPATSREYSSVTEFKKAIKEILYKQEITFPIYIQNCNDFRLQRSFKSYPANKRESLSKAKSCADYLSGSFIISSEYFHSLDIIENLNQEKKLNNKILEYLLDSIQNGKIYDEDLVNVELGDTSSFKDELVKKLIDAWNDKTSTSSESGEKKYSELKEENKDLKNKLKEIEKEKEALLIAKEELELANVELEKTNDLQKQMLDIYEEANEKVMKLKN